MSDPPWTGDPNALLAHADWVRGLARSLTRTPDHAEDVEQQAWLGILGKPPADARNLRAWLASVVRNTARQLGRGETRRSWREAATAAAEAAPPATELAERAELQRDVVSTVLALDEPYRTTILLRYWGAHSPVEIARLQGVPAGTVRSRLHRAHAELRAGLDRRVRGGRSAWSTTLLAWCRPGEAKEVTASASSLLAGVAVMSWKLKLGLVVFVAASAAWWVLREGPTVAEDRRPNSSVDPASSLATPPERPGAREELRGPALTAAVDERTPVPAAASLAAIHGTVATPDGEPVAHAALTLYPDVPDWRERAPLGAGTSDDAGSFRIEDYTPGLNALVIHAEADGYRSTSAEFGLPAESLELVLSRLGELAGTVRDAETGAPLAGATIVWSREPSATTDARGFYRLRGVPTGRSFRFYARARGYAEDAVELELTSSEESGALDFELRRGAPLVVEVFDRESGAPVADADVHGDPSVSPLARTDASGRCEIQVLAGEELYLRVDAESYYPFIWFHRVEDVGRALSPRIPLAPLGVIEGLVADGDGSPVPGAVVQVQALERGFGSLSLSREEREALDLPGHATSDMLHRIRERTDERGTFRIQVLPGSSPQRVVALRPDGSSVRSEPVLVESSRARVRVDLHFGASANVVGRVAFNGEPRIGAEVRWRHAGSGDVGSSRSDEEGRFELTDVRPGAVTVFVVGVELGAFGSLPSAELVVAAGESYEQDLAWTVDVATITGRVTSTAGEPLAGIRVGASRDPLGPVERARFEATTAEDGTYAVEVLAAAIYEVTAGREFNERSCSNVAAGATDVDLVLPQLGVVPLQLVDAETGESVSVRSPDVGLNWRETGREAFRWSLAKFSHSGFAEVHLPVGSVDLSVFVNEFGYAPAMLRGIRVTDEPSRRPVVLALRRGVTARLTLRTKVGAEDVSFRGHHLFLLEESQLHLLRAGSEPDGELFNNRHIGGTRYWVGDPGLLKQRLEPDGRGRVDLPGLAPGRYYLRAYPPGLVFEPESFDVDDDASEPIEIRCWRR